jgi:cysteine desulfurase / selenocysteine lyase
MFTSTLNQTYQHLFVGLDAPIPTLNGKKQRYVNLDSAASTPPFKAVQEAVDHFAPYYSSVHRGMGYKSQLSTYAFEKARMITLRFLGASPETHVCIFGKNATEAINTLAHRFPFTRERNIVLTSGMEHHSNDLPWRSVAEVIHLSLTQNGALDEEDFDEKLEEYTGRIALVAISGASNVTGFLNPIHRLAKKAHAVGAQIAVDCAQLAPHRKIDMGSLDDPQHLDYIALSAHKMYAPYGTGALIGRRDTFERGTPFLHGGGTVKIVTLDEVHWANFRDEAGSPNTIGTVALAAAIQELERIGMDRVAEHEISLTRYAFGRIKEVPGIKIYGDSDPEHTSNRLGVITFNLQGISDILVTAILGYEFGIGLRNGRFCAYPYTMALLELSPEEVQEVNHSILAGDYCNIPGLVRASLGLYNTPADVDALVEALICIVNKNYQGNYTQNLVTGDFIPEGWQPQFDEILSL